MVPVTSGGEESGIGNRKEEREEGIPMRYEHLVIARMDVWIVH